MSTAVHQITLQEFMARPIRDDDQCEELIEGELILSPGAKPSHASLIGKLRHQLASLENPSLENQGYELANEFSCILGGRSMPVPDLAVMERDRWDKAVAADEWLDGSPELVIEVASPSNRKLKRKAALYLEHGAEQVWIVYRKTQTVTVVTAKSTTEALIDDRLEFHGVSVPVSSIFPPG